MPVEGLYNFSEEKLIEWIETILFTSHVYMKKTYLQIDVLTGKLEATVFYRVNEDSPKRRVDLEWTITRHKDNLATDPAGFLK